MKRLAPCLSALLTALILVATPALPAQQEVKFEPIAGITPERLQQFVFIKGTVVTHRQPWNERAPHLITIKDDSGTVDVVFWKDTYAGIEGKEAIAPGVELWVYAEVDEYRGNVQLRLAQPNHLRVMSASGDGAAAGAPPATGVGAVPAGGGPRPVAIGAITNQFLQQQVVVRGRALQLIQPDAGSRAPYRLTLEDSTGTITVVYWEDTATQIPAASRPVVDGVYEVAGKVDEHRGNLQLRVERPDAIRPAQAGAPGAAAPAQPPAEASALMPPPPGTSGENPAAALGEFRNVNPFDPSAATATQPEQIASAPAPVVATPAADVPPPPPSMSPWGAPASSAPATSAPPAMAPPSAPPAGAPPVGASRPMSAPVSPPGGSTTPPPPGAAVGSAVPFTPSAPPSAPPVAPVAVASPAGSGAKISSITPASAGMTLRVEGKVERVTRTPSSMLVRINDGTGRVSVFISGQVMKAAAGRLDALEQGWTLRVEGTVKIYNERPEIHPATAAGILESKRPS